MTGGVGHDDLYRFYRDHFIPTLPKDTKLVPISRTVGADRVVDELLFCFTHDREIDWHACLACRRRASTWRCRP